ncbi:PIG-L deacetylase family protein [Pelolinea submarina]|uniref:Mycothiol S-conjugate amidase n=1 Tax=Pelolinea submarina TaxID=913107 RepID=A0A347ZV76_9CHLR|nr:PIG-L family deacetylase [Pelolinea submarina]REG10207.1 mycothiol S-conjugate amidase [Pelolinea submarina]BBB49207.1 N-acetyl-1-D-myo-inositol-2-amino-2-deoxy-alpha-D-glucopyranoside deacetylase [Pelolinea submarina]
MTENKRRLLVVLAHPDDETFGMGGTLALYARRGVEVHLVCATRGEVGEVEPERLAGFASVGELREHELCCAAEVLGLRKVHFLGYRDSGMPGSADNQHPQALVQAPVEKVAAQVAAYIRELQPQVVLTFDPVGGYMHPDHIAIHNATVLAFEMAGDPKAKGQTLPPFTPQKLYFHTMPHGFMKLAVKLMPLFGKDPSKFGKNEDIDLTAVLANDFPTNARINYKKVAPIREQASACHASQGGDRTSGYLVTWLLRQISSTETFMRAVPPPAKGYVEKDLFEGIK